MVKITVNLEDDYVIKLDRLARLHSIDRERVSALVIKDFIDKVERFVMERLREKKKNDYNTRGASRDWQDIRCDY